MNEALQNLEIKVENGGTTPQGRLTSSEWNILVAAVKALDADSVDPSQLEAYLKPYAKTADVSSTYATIASLSAVTSRLNDFLAGSDTDAIINKWSELETFLAGLTETDNLATILSGKANKATTLAGYGITDAYTKSHIDSNFVTIGTKQQITGEKDFVGGFKVNGGLVEYNATLKAWVLNGDLLVTGGVSAFSNISGFKPSTITDAVLIDDRTIKRNADGLLYAVAQGAGGINEDQLADYLTTNGYATQSWVTGKGYITSSALEPYALKTAIPTNTNQLTNGAGFITGITGAMVTSALGYTPYNSANFTKANIKSTLGISDWALASAKPTYSASEVGALAQDSSSVNADLDTILDSKTAVLKPFFQAITGTNIGSARKGVLRMSYNGSESQLLFDHYNRLLRYRTIGNNPKDWATIAFTSDIPTKLSQLTDDVVSGKYLSLAGGTVSGDVTANNFIATNALKTNTGIRDCINIVTTYNYPAIAMKGSNHTAGYVRLFNRGGADWAVTDENWTNSYTLLHSGNYSNYALPKDGTAVAANRLLTLDNKGMVYQTASILYVGDNSYLSTPTHILGKSIRLRYGASAATGLELTETGNVAIGGTTASEKLHVHGNLLATGAITMYYSSDKRLKQNIRKINASEVLMSLGGVYQYKYIDSEVEKNHIYEGTHYGLIYQHVKGSALDKMCHKREDGMGALNYVDADFISIIAGATMENISEVGKLKREIRTLENKVKQLERVA